jgi:hypothetical protein
MFLNLNINTDNDFADENVYDPLRSQKELEKKNIKKYENFIKKLYNMQKYKKGRKKGLIIKKYNDCPVKIDLEDGKRGASGVLDIKLDQTYLDRESYIVQQHFLKGAIFQKFYFPRLKNYCKDITKYIKRSSKIFPNNFLKIKNCKYCLYKGIPFGKKILDYDVKISYRMQNASYKKKNSDNFADDISKKIYTDIDLSSLFLQIYYISIVCNKKGIFHNDLKAANIVINRAKKNFYYTGLGNLKIHIRKNDFIPIFVDYDLISFKDIGHDHPASGTSEDFNFFAMKISEKNPKLYKRFKDIMDLPQYDKRINSKNLKLIFKKYNIES